MTRELCCAASSNHCILTPVKLCGHAQAELILFHMLWLFSVTSLHTHTYTMKTRSCEDSCVNAPVAQINCMLHVLFAKIWKQSCLGYCWLVLVIVVFALLFKHTIFVSLKSVSIYTVATSLSTSS